MHIQEWWIASASVLCSLHECVERSVDLALKIAESVSRLVAAEQIQLHQITTGNITIRVSGAPSNLSIESVQFNAVSSSLGSLRSLSIQEGNGDEMHVSEGPRIELASACVALGNIFLELFSKGRDGIMLKDSTGVKDNIGISTGSKEFAAPPGKRKTPRELSLSKCASSTKAKHIFEELGMPVSISRLVCDLLDAEDEECVNMQLSLDDVLFDLNKMRNDPNLFLFDRTCPQVALEDACLFGSTYMHLFGRGEELAILTDSVNSIAQSMKTPSPSRAPSFVCNSIFLDGYAGSGKSVILKRMINICTHYGWFIIDCKFRKHVPSERVLANAFNAFFEQWVQPETTADINSPQMNQFHSVCKRIFNSVDCTGFHQLIDLVPNLSQAFPWRSNQEESDTSSSMETVGAARKHLKNQFHILFKSLCESGCPILLSCDDMQWCDSFTLECICEFVSYHGLDTRTSEGTDRHNQGMLILGSFRNNEFNSKALEDFENLGEGATTKVPIGDLTEEQLTNLISRKLCLPTRYTQDLAALVQSKTRGNAFWCIQFLKSLVQNHMLEYSVKNRRWSWDLEVIEQQMIPEGVAELLIARFHQLPDGLLKTLEVLSSLGSQVNRSTIDILNTAQTIVFDMHDELDLAINEGFLEKVGPIYLAAPGANDGPIYQFTHDTIQQTIYDSMSTAKRKLLHISNGECLLTSENNNPSVHLLAVNQINLYCEDQNLSPEERSQFAYVNATAAKYAVAAYSFGQARSYVNAGMKLLNTNHWEEQYSLSLVLYEMSASVNCMLGDIDTMPETLGEITANAKSFEDSLTASGLLAKLLAASSNYDDAIKVCLSVLTNLGETFPENINRIIVIDEFLTMRTILQKVDSIEKVKLLPDMTDNAKLHAMKFLSMMSNYSVIAKPMMFPLTAKRLLTITIEHGFCEDSIKGLVTTGWALFAYSNETQLGHKISKVGASLAEECPNKFILLARICGYIGWLNAAVEPLQSVLDGFLDRHNAGMLAGDHESAMLSRWGWCAVSFHSGNDSLLALSKQVVVLIRQAAKYQQNTLRYAAMSILRLCISLTGVTPEEANAIEIKSDGQLDHIAQNPPNAFLSYQHMLCKVTASFWKRDFMKVLEYTTSFHSQSKRILESSLTFFEGMASLSLARKTRQPKWGAIGERAMTKMNHLVHMSTWNYENKSKLLEAEFHYVNGDLESAEIAYKASVTSAFNHKFIHEEACAREAYGIFLVENRYPVKGAEQLRIALVKYKEWGALKKAEDLQSLIQMSTPSPNMNNPFF